MSRPSNQTSPTYDCDLRQSHHSVAETMRFSTLAVLAVLAPASSGFVVPSQRQNAGVAFRNAAPLSMALEDLESKLLNPEESKKKKPQRAKPEPKPKPQKKAPEPKKSKKDIAAEAKQKAEELKRIAESEKAAAAAAAKKAEKKAKSEVKEVKAAAKSAKYTLDTDLDKPKKSRVKKDFDLPKAPSIKAPSVNFPKRPKPGPKPKAVAKPSGPADPNAGPVGVALGAAPLVAVPILGLAAARGALSKTAARRAVIQKEMAAAEEARKKKAIQVDVDAGALAKATVCTRNEYTYLQTFFDLTLLLASFATGILWCRCRGTWTRSYCSFRGC